ncbi:CopG family transcriptional regulator [Vibrio anguillarum]|uniref:CopG family transcriptional regulator n=2 Tax=Vibrio anguillarum TaxID=55601 RepID=A0AAW4BCW9_VIBAN|nr:CopG family transcriptional regulator [Vibrio anguillarum]ASG03031.1 CopG family transcriptional regulator [Vibrio anguillarum]MBF4434146.1 CopG family transcriptional regulator [Vibrio anguillarum]
MKITQDYLENDIYNLISKDTFELVAHHLLLNSNDTSEYKFNKKIFSIKHDKNAINSKINSIIQDVIDISHGYKKSQIHSKYIYRNAPAIAEINDYLKSERSKKILSKSDLEWIKMGNSRQCLFLFSLLFIHYNQTSILEEFTILSSKSFKNVILDKITDVDIQSKMSILNNFDPNITHSFDLMHEHLFLFFMSINKKEAIVKMDELKEKWSSALKNNNHDWIDKKNTVQIHWIVEYFKKSNIELWFINNNEDIDYKYYSCLTLLDLWQEDYFIPGIGSKNYFLEKIKRSWSQQKYRLSVKDKKSINLRVDKEIEKKINKLCADSKLTKSQLIELLLKK